MDINDIDSIINHPSFGRAMGSPKFRSLIKSYMSKNPYTKNISIEIENGKPVFAVRKGFERLTYTDMNEAVDASVGPLSSVRRYTPDKMRVQPFIGPARNERLEELSRMLGIDIEVRSYHLGDGSGKLRTASEYIKADLQGTTDDLHALLIPDSEVTHAVRMFKNGKKLSYDEILGQLKNAGIDIKDTADGGGSLWKRLRSLVADRSMDIAQETGTYKIGFFKPQDLFNISLKEAGVAGEAYKSAMGDVLKQQGKMGYQRMFEGALLGSEDFVRDFLKSLDQRAQKYTHLAAQLQKAGKVDEANQAQKHANALYEELNKVGNKLNNMLAGKTEGFSVNTRILGGDGFDEHLKGDMPIFSRDRFRQMAKQLGFTDKNMPSLLAGDFEKKGEITSTRFAFQTMELHPGSGSVYTHSLETATFPEFFGRDYLEGALEREFGEISDAMKSGQLPPGMKSQLQDVINFDLAGLSSQEMSEISNLQKYARELLAVSNNGLPITSFKSTSALFLEGYRKHFSKFRSGHFGEFLATGDPDYDMRIKIPGGISAHAHTHEITRLMTSKASDPTRLMMSSIMFDKQSGRLSVSGIDVSTYFTAFGGPDLDDRLKAISFYDPKAKRNMARVFRDPNERREYGFFLADMESMSDALKEDVPVQISALHRDKRNLVRKLYSQKNKGITKFNMDDDNTAGIIKQIQSINEQLDQFYMSSQAIEKVDVAEKVARGLVAPKGMKANLTKYQGMDVVHALQGSGLTPEQFAEVLFNNLGNNIGQNLTPFEYVSEFYNQFDDSRNMLLVKNSADVAKYEAAGARTGSVMGMDKYLASKGVVIDAQQAKLTKQAFARNILDLKAEHGHILGSYVNSKALVDQMAASLDSPEVRQRLAAAGIDTEAQINKFKSAVIGRELIIDATQKEYDEVVVRAAQLSIDEMTDQVVAQSMKLKELGIADAGIDPTLFHGRFKEGSANRYVSAARRYIEESDEKDGMWKDISDEDLLSEKGFLAPRTGDFSKHTQVMDMFRSKSDEQIAAIKKSMDELTDTFQDGVYGTNVFSADDLDFANRYVNEYDEVRKATKTDLEDIGRILEAGDDFDLEESFFGMEERNRRMIGFLENEGLITGDEVRMTPELRHKMLAVGHYVRENEKTLARRFGRAEAPLLLSSAQEGLSISDLFMGSVSAEVNSGPVKEFWKLANLTKKEQLEALGYSVTTGQDGAIKITKTAPDLMTVIPAHNAPKFRYDPRIPASQRPTRKIKKVSEIVDTLPDITSGMTKAHWAAWRELQDVAKQVEGSFPGSKLITQSVLNSIHTDDVPESGGKWLIQPLSIDSMFGTGQMPPGYKKAVAKEAADSEAINVVQKTVSRAYKEKWGQLLETKGVRGALVGLGAFVTAGLMYGMTHHDRSSEQLQGPPLLPGGSSYEDYSDMESVSSIYPSVSRGQFNPGMLYQVSARGSFDAVNLQSQIQSITGSPVNSTIYKSRPILNRATSSPDRLRNSMNGA